MWINAISVSSLAVKGFIYNEEWKPLVCDKTQDKKTKETEKVGCKGGAAGRPLPRVFHLKTFSSPPRETQNSQGRFGALRGVRQRAPGWDGFCLNEENIKA